VNPANILKDRAVMDRKLDELAHAAALEEFESGKVRSGLMAKALAESAGDEAKAKARYLQLLVGAVKDDMYIANRITEPRGDAEVLTRGICSLLIPGLGQFLQGRNKAAAWQFFPAIVLWFVLLGWVMHLWSAFDAARYERARLNSAQ
jgi:hypothetical protein